MLRKLSKNIIIVLFILMVKFNLLSQTVNTTDSVTVQLIARAYKDKVILRWAPTTPLAWQHANKYGYTIERITMTRKNKLVKEREISKLTDLPIKMWPEDRWESIVKDSSGNIDKYVAIAAQAIFGESFNLMESYSGDYMKAIEKVQENEKRFTFALFAADQSLKTSEAMGLLFIDNNVKADEKYLYRVYTNVPSSIMIIDTGYIYTGPQDYGPLPKPLNFGGTFENQLVNLSWNRDLFENIYTNYIVERSDNSKEFLPLDDIPFINTSPDEYKNPRMMYRVDSLPDNKKTYYYRLRGRTPFNEFGPWSDTISVHQVSSMVISPTIISLILVDNKQVDIKWDFPEEKNNEIEYFSIYRSGKANGQYLPIAQNLNSDIRLFSDKNPQPGNYYIIRAFNEYGQSSASFPAFAQLVDSFPPTKPLKPNVSADSTGIVHISWKNVPDEDVIGYRIFRSNFQNSEFGQITVSPVNDTIYNEKIELNNLEPYIYYKIAAVDYNFNQSELSQEAILEKPDTMAPVPPLFKSVKSSSKGVLVKWISSPSKDVVYYQLLRRNSGTEKWEKIAQIESKDSIFQYLDTLATPGIEMEYAMNALDKNKNQSEYSKSVFAGKIENGVRPAIKNITFMVDRTKKHIELKWKYSLQNVENYLIYRTEQGNPMSYYKMIKANENSFLDKDIKINTTYIYQIKVTFENGAESGLSNKIVVIY